MISLKQWMEIVNYRITEGSHFGWQCFGDNAYTLDSWDGDFDGHTHSITFDTKTQEVYVVEVFDYSNKRAYRIVNPDYKKVHDSEARAHGGGDEAWDGVNFTDLETDEDWIEKAQAIASGIDYDTRISVPLDIPDEELLKYLIFAHERDITFNQLVEEALTAAVAEFKRDPDGFKQRANKWAADNDFA